jgi:hypothetical protein
VYDPLILSSEKLYACGLMIMKESTLLSLLSFHVHDRLNGLISCRRTTRSSVSCVGEVERFESGTQSSFASDYHHVMVFISKNRT